MSSEKKRQPHVLIVVPILNVGGTENQLLLVLPHLVIRGYSVSIYTTRGRGDLDKSFRKLGVEVVNGSGRLPSLTGALYAAVKFAGFLRRRKPSLVHFILPEAYLIGGLGALLTGTKPRVMSRRSLNRYQDSRRYVAALEGWLHRRMDLVVANSAAVARELEFEGVDTRKLIVINNGIVPRECANSDRESVRRKFLLNAHSLVLTCVANLFQYKGHADLFDAMAEIKDRLPEGWVLLLAGRDEGVERQLRMQADRLGISSNIRWLGQRDDVADLFAAADIGLLCSHEEGFPNVVLEGQAFGVPMIVTDAGGSSEAVVDGRTGLVVPAQSPASIAEAILLLARDPTLRARMGKEAKTRVRENFSLGACVDQYDCLYSRLLTEREAIAGSVRESD